jgi:type IV pilus assembly protein PilP
MMRLSLHSRAPAVTTAAVAAVLAVAGCSADNEELRQWMDQQRREAQANPQVPPQEPPKKFDPQPYAMSGSVDPFTLQKLAVAFKPETREQNSLLTAELTRRKEPLEAYPLDTMSMVGSFVKQAQPFALLRVDSLVYQVKVGDHLGQNYGLITRISETEVLLREIVQDAAGETIERPATLQLQERTK